MGHSDLTNIEIYHPMGQNQFLPDQLIDRADSTC